MSDVRKQKSFKKQAKPDYRQKMSTVGMARDEHEFSATLTTDLKKLNKNKFFFNTEGKNNPNSQD